MIVPDSLFLSFVNPVSFVSHLNSTCVFWASFSPLYHQADIGSYQQLASGPGQDMVDNVCQWLYV